MSKYFIDISENNTILSYAAIPSCNLSGVIIKATEGTTYIDHMLEINYNALSKDLAIGFYHFLTSSSSPITQAQNFWNKIKDKEYQIMPVLDIEQVSLKNNAESFADQFLEEFYKLSGQNMIIYSSKAYIEEHFSNEFKSNNIWWVADYSANDVPKIQSCNIIGWQYTDNCQSYAFSMGHLDCSVLIDEDIFFIKKEDKKVENIVVYNTGADERAANYLADFLNCPTINNSRKFDFSCVKNVYAVGGNSTQYTSYVKQVISGADEYETMKAVLNYIGK
jgi:hypothetical protein